jgi:hypothetical protein
MNETHVAAVARGVLQRNMEINDLDLVLDERTTGFAVLPAPLNGAEISAIPFP